VNEKLGKDFVVVTAEGVESSGNGVAEASFGKCEVGGRVERREEERREGGWIEAKW
jgi:hypothetical protein